MRKYPDSSSDIMQAKEMNSHFIFFNNYFMNLHDFTTGISKGINQHL